MKYYIATYGCQTNKADSERITTRLENSGYKATNKMESADLIVINACSVRQSAIDRVYAMLHKIKQLKANSENSEHKSKVVLAGCVLPSDRKKLKNVIDEFWHPDEYFDLAPHYSNPFSANVPIMSGCDNFCTYCAVPFTRGRERSRPAEDIVKEVKNLVEKNYKEIWLLGQNVNSYRGVIREEPNFSQLIRLLNAIPGNFWIRFTSPHPKDFTSELIKAMAECEKVTEYLNLPVQSGDNEILKKMNRNYTAEHYVGLIKKIRAKIPEISLSTDTIVGFPSETKKQFQNTANLYKKIGFDMAFIAEYSPRPGTAAALTMKDNVTAEEKKKRRIALTKILRKSAFKNNKKLLGKTTEVIVDHQKNNRFFGRTRGNKAIEISGDNIKIGGLVKVKITGVKPFNLKGEIAMPKIVAIIGPTASGKSALAMKIAKKFNGEIVSADSRQIYREMDIGTAKLISNLKSKNSRPTSLADEVAGGRAKLQLKNQGSKIINSIPHWMIDIKKPNENYTVAEYKKNAISTINTIIQKRKLPILVGGTGLYVSSIVENLEIPAVKENKKIRTELQKKISQKGLGFVFKKLIAIDPEAAYIVDSKNPRRVIRALEIAITSGKKFSDQRKKGVPIYDILQIGLNPPQEILEGKISQRTGQMIKNGLVEETKELIKKYDYKRRAFDAIGYKEIIDYLKNKISLKKAEEEINKNTLGYAKRQMTWFKKYNHKANWLTNKNEVRLYNRAIDLVKNFYKYSL